MEKESLNVIHRLRARLGREAFQPTLLSLLFSPVYIIRRALFVTIRELSPAIAGDVLDFGCGSKPYEHLFSNATTYVGVDLQGTGHDHIDSRVDVFYDGKVLPFPDGQFDAVLSFEVFEHVFNLPEILREIARVTRSSGHLLASLPFAWQEHETPYDFARYTSFGIVHLLSEAGYEVLEVRKTTTHLMATVQMFVAYLTLAPGRYKISRYFLQIGVAFPCTLLAYVLNVLLPKNHDSFCNLVVLARKRAPETALEPMWR